MFSPLRRVADVGGEAADLLADAERLGLLGGELGRHRPGLGGHRARRGVVQHGEQLLGQVRGVDPGPVHRGHDADGAAGDLEGGVLAPGCRTPPARRRGRSAARRVDADLQLAVLGGGEGERRRRWPRRAPRPWRRRHRRSPPPGPPAPAGPSRRAPARPPRRRHRTGSTSTGSSSGLAGSGSSVRAAVITSRGAPRGPAPGRRRAPRRSPSCPRSAMVASTGARSTCSAKVASWASKEPSSSATADSSTATSGSTSRSEKNVVTPGPGVQRLVVGRVDGALGVQADPGARGGEDALDVVGDDGAVGGDPAAELAPRARRRRRRGTGHRSRPRPRRSTAARRRRRRAGPRRRGRPARARAPAGTQDGPAPPPGGARCVVGRPAGGGAVAVVTGRRSRSPAARRWRDAASRWRRRPVSASAASSAGTARWPSTGGTYAVVSTASSSGRAAEPVAGHRAGVVDLDRAGPRPGKSSAARACRPRPAAGREGSTGGRLSGPSLRMRTVSSCPGALGHGDFLRLPSYRGCPGTTEPPALPPREAGRRSRRRRRVRLSSRARR